MYIRNWKSGYAKDVQNGELLFVETEAGTELAIKVLHEYVPGAKPTHLFLSLARNGQKAAFGTPSMRYAQELALCTSTGSDWVIETDIDAGSIYTGEVVEGVGAHKAIEIGCFWFQGSYRYLHYDLDESIAKLFGSAGLFSAFPETRGPDTKYWCSR